jgi:hypothetical protein
MISLIDIAHFLLSDYLSRRYIAYIYGENQQPAVTPVIAPVASG